MGKVVEKLYTEAREWRLQLDEWGKQIQSPYNEIDPMKIRQKDKKKAVLNEPKCTYYGSIPMPTNELKEPREPNELRHDENAWKAKMDKADVLCEKMEKKNLVNSKQQVSEIVLQNKMCSKRRVNENAVVALCGLSWSGAAAAKMN
eukprot:1726099-Ditylum_brightwellii.AAC.1